MASSKKVCCTGVYDLGCGSWGSIATGHICRDYIVSDRDRLVVLEIRTVVMLGVFDIMGR